MSRKKINLTDEAIALLAGWKEKNDLASYSEAVVSLAGASEETESLKREVEQLKNNALGVNMGLAGISSLSGPEAIMAAVNQKAEELYKLNLLKQKGKDHDAVFAENESLKAELAASKSGKILADGLLGIAPALVERITGVLVKNYPTQTSALLSGLSGAPEIPADVLALAEKMEGKFSKNEMADLNFALAVFARSKDTMAGFCKNMREKIAQNQKTKTDESIQNNG